MSARWRVASRGAEISLFLEMNAGRRGRRDRAAPEGREQARQLPLRAARRGSAPARAAGLGDVLGGLKANPLPDAFVLAPRREDPALFERMADACAPGKVAHVQLDSAWVEAPAASCSASDARRC